MKLQAQKELRWCGAALSAVLMLVVAGCLVPLSEEQGETMYYHNWWNYYGRAVYRLKQGRVVDAREDFERCLGLRSGARFGNAQDMWRARTYGLHFYEGYFPNRELGICLYEANEVTQAIKYLETSLQQEPSGRAKHYLNLARAKEQAGRPVALPRFHIAENNESLFIRERRCVIAGSVSGDGLIRHLSVGGHAEFIELAQPSLNFEQSVTLLPGTNVVEIQAEDLQGQRVVRKLVRVADWQPPRLLLRRVVPAGNDWLVEGVCRDESGLTEVMAGTTQIYRLGTGTASHEVPVSMRVTPAGATLSAVDCAGNRLECPLTPAALKADQDAVPLASVTFSAAGFAGGMALLAGVGDIVCVCDARVNSAETPDARSPLRFDRVCDEFLLAAATQTNPQTADRLRPSLTLKDCQPLTRVFAEDFFLDGKASDGGGLSSVTINGENLLEDGDEGTLRAYFMRRIPLDLGTNKFEVVATDKAGNRTVRALDVIRLQPEYQDDTMRLSIGVPPLTPADAGYVGVRVKRSMEMELTRSPVRFRLLERNEGWDFVLREQGLSVSDLADPSAALRIGKMVPADMLLMGKIFAEAKGLTVYVKAVETADGEVLFASDVYSSDPERSLDEVVAGLVLKVQQGFPLVSGKVLEHQGALVTLNVGSGVGVTENSRFLVVGTQNDSDVKGGRVCKHGQQPVQLQIVGVQQNTCTARVIPSEANDIVKEGYYVYTR